MLTVRFHRAQTGCNPSQYSQHFNFRFILRLSIYASFSTHYHALHYPNSHLKKLLRVLFVKVISYQLQSVRYRHAICRIYA